ncbi:MAG TPA: putative 2-aminoethylphosphonate ABC transporter ATP-binding protein [Alphaproteobacteria bacterium]|nr:putative 2-aminoethylphosphonate ABC transporter ATP-binding protein [Alphaproteobacteria bacterium]
MDVKSNGGAPASVGAPYLQIEGVSKLFGLFTALNHVSFDIYRGEFVCFLGPSGCGKTTLLRAIAGLDLQTSGRIEQDGRDISNLPPSGRDYGIVFQSYALFPNLNVFDNVAYGLRSRRLPRAAMETRVAELLALVGLPGEVKKYPSQLSGGQQQRIAVARALATSPGLLLLDEPLSALDARVRVRLRHEIKALQRRLGVTTIMVTHDQEEALTMADRIVVMNQGVIEQIGAPIEIYRQPATPFVADFVGTMNFLDGTLVAPGRVRLGAVEVACGASDGLAPGAAVQLCFRPEDVSVREVGRATPNVIDVTIEGLEFLGSFCRGTLRPLDSGSKQFVADFSINLVRDFDLTVGRNLPIALPADRLRVYPKA